MLISSKRADSLVNRRSAVLSIYLGAVLAGLTLVSFSACSSTIKSLQGFSDEAYGSIFLPQLVAAAIGALGGASFGARLGLKRQFLIGLVGFACALLLLAALFVVPRAIALPVAMAATASFGFGFGFGGGPMNAFAAALFPSTAGSAVTALHMCAGIGLCVAPFYFAGLTAATSPLVAPLALVVVTGLAIYLALRSKALRDPPAVAAGELVRPPSRSWLFFGCAIATIVYAVIEGVFSNWAVLYLSEDRALDGGFAAAALSVFWFALTVGRLAIVFIAKRFDPLTILFVLALMMIAALLALPQVDGRTSAIASFALAGFACSGFFPMMLAHVARVFPGAMSWLASMLTAALMIGVGLGSFGVGRLRDTFELARIYQLSTVFPALIIILLLLIRTVWLRTVARGTGASLSTVPLGVRSDESAARDQG